MGDRCVLGNWWPSKMYHFLCAEDKHRPCQLHVYLSPFLPVGLYATHVCRQKCPLPRLQVFCSPNEEEKMCKSSIPVS